MLRYFPIFIWPCWLQNIVGLALILHRCCWFHSSRCSGWLDSCGSTGQHIRGVDNWSLFCSAICRCAFVFFFVTWSISSYRSDVLQTHPTIPYTLLQPCFSLFFVLVLQCTCSFVVLIFLRHTDTCIWKNGCQSVTLVSNEIYHDLKMVVQSDIHLCHNKSGIVLYRDQIRDQIFAPT